MARLTTLKPRVQLLHKPAGTWQDERRGSSTERGYGAEWQRTVKRIRARDADLCQPCVRRGEIGFYAAVDHIAPKSRGGSDADSNLQVICGPCHKAKTAQEARGLEWDETISPRQIARHGPSW